VPIPGAPDPARIEDLLTSAYGTAVRIDRIDHITPWFVLRARLSGDGVPASVIVKWLRNTPGDTRTDSGQLYTEQAALEFLAEIDAELAPRLVAADIPASDPGRGFLVIEDLEPGEPLRAVLLRVGADATRPRLTSYARALARLHGSTIGHAESYAGHRHALGLGESPRSGLLTRWPSGVRCIRDIGVPMSHVTAGELAGVIAEFSYPGAFLAFSNGDAQHNNYLVDPAGNGRMIDFEGALFQHAMIDLCHLYVPGSMWLTVQDPTSNGLEEAYRNELAPTVPEVTDDVRFGRAIAGAAFLGTLERVSALDRLDARAAGDRSRLHRIATLEAAAETAATHHCLPHLAGWARAAAERLRRRWPDADVDLAALGPYASR
jgi:hypothetical protein